MDRLLQTWRSYGAGEGPFVMVGSIPVSQAAQPAAHPNDEERDQPQVPSRTCLARSRNVKSLVYEIQFHTEFTC